MTIDFPVNLQKPVIFFDVETTGLDPKYDRLIELGAVKIFPDGARETFHQRFNPQMRIPAEVSALTGISNEDVATAPTFAQLAPVVSSFFDGADIAGYNVARFDAKVMTEEYKRVGMDFRLAERALLDVQTIFHLKEKRDLSAAYKYYCDKNLEGAHSATADSNATLDIFLAQMKRYEDLPKDMSGLHKFCRANKERFVDSEGKFSWRDGEAIFNFGRYKSQTLRAVAKADTAYFHWMISPERQFAQDVIDICYKAMKGEFPKKNAEES
jgi:DNA polymerase-3 subunit epsilon